MQFKTNQVTHQVRPHTVAILSLALNYCIIARSCCIEKHDFFLSDYCSHFSDVQMYRIHGTVVYLSMSADASCRGLRAPTDGPTILELTQGICVALR